MQEKYSNQSIGYYFIIAASVVVVFAGIKMAAELIVPFLLSLFLAIILSPAYNYFKKKGFGDFFALSIVIGIFILFIGSIAKLLGSSIAEFSSNIDFYEEQIVKSFSVLDDLSGEYGFELVSHELTSSIDSKQIMLFSTGILQGVGSLLSNGFVIIFTLIFMLIESNSFTKKISSIQKNKDNTNKIKTITVHIKDYMVLKSLISLFTGLIIWVSLSIIGTDYAFLWAVLAFLLNFIPNIGSIIAAVPAVILTFIQLGFVSSLFVVVVYLSVNVIIGSVVEPKVMGKGLGLSALVVFLSLLFWGWLLGSVGMLLSIPLTIMAKIIFDSNQETKWISTLLGNGDK